MFNCSFNNFDGWNILAVALIEILFPFILLLLSWKFSTWLLRREQYFPLQIPAKRLSFLFDTFVFFPLPSLTHCDLIYPHNNGIRFRSIDTILPHPPHRPSHRPNLTSPSPSPRLHQTPRFVLRNPNFLPSAFFLPLLLQVLLLLPLPSPLLL